MGNSTTTPVRPELQREITRPRPVLNPRQFTRGQLMFLIPYLGSLERLRAFALVSKKCAAAIIFRKTNPFYTNGSPATEVALFTGAKALNVDYQTCVNTPLPLGVVLHLSICCSDERTTPDCSLITSVVASLDLQLYRDIVIPLKSLTDLRRVRITFWSKMSARNILAMAEQLLFIPNLRVCSFELEGRHTDAIRFAVNELAAKHVRVIVKIHDATEESLCFRESLYLHIGVFRHTLNKSLIEERAFILPHEGQTIPLTSVVVGDRRLLARIVRSYYPRSLSISGSARVNSFDLAPHTCIQSLTLSNVASIAITKMTLPTSLMALQIDSCSDIRSLGVPGSLTQLVMCACENLPALNINGQNTLQSLKLGFCNNLRNVDFCPSLTLLEIKHCTQLTSIGFPAKLQSLELCSFTVPRNFSAPLLKRLVLVSCLVEQWKDLLKSPLNELRITSMLTPKTLVIPTSVSRLELAACEGLTSIPNLHLCQELPPRVVAKYGHLDPKVRLKRFQTF